MILHCIASLQIGAAVPFNHISSDCKFLHMPNDDGLLARRKKKRVNTQNSHSMFSPPMCVVLQKKWYTNNPTRAGTVMVRAYGFGMNSSFDLAISCPSPLL